MIERYHIYVYVCVYRILESRGLEEDRVTNGGKIQPTHRNYGAMFHGTTSTITTNTKNTWRKASVHVAVEHGITHSSSNRTVCEHKRLML